MGALQDKYASVVIAAQNAGISGLQVQEQDGILYISGSAANTNAKDAVWNALGAIDATYSASDININVQVSGLTPGTSLKVITESSNLNLRQEPSTEAAVVGKAAHGSMVSLVEQSNSEWWKIKNAEGVEGYAYARYLQA
ncbi:SH3 domain-containing protein [Elizabethkingia sp. JS20170427COW]|uniref:SH3 domain-containing protein n=1 Tax=Elizabethkingia sp. JS20170427COW TaxID=2583851 RepID=UPI001110285D|nr:SH3 domain-containing protein [Elizabethkingia sp. JS20170427COW]QCX53061.1 SH3 domain-containing protein [Elizabethkingia sp. JS20170427COW]